jgi:hypothetical protein
MGNPAPRRLRTWLIAIALALAGTLALPVGAYVAAKRVVGSYEGKYGLSDYVASITAGAGRGEPAAWVLLLAPTALVLVWLTVGWGFRRLGRSRPARPGPPGPARPAERRPPVL